MPAPAPIHLRIARPVTDLEETLRMYTHGLALAVVGRFSDHEGFDGVMLGHAGAGYHFEFTKCRSHPMAPSATAEDLAVFYIPSPDEWQAACDRMLAAGFTPVRSFNPYWDARGRSFEDRDGYRVVLQNDRWANTEET